MTGFTHTFQAGKKLCLVIQKYVIVLFPPIALPAIDPKHADGALEDLTTLEWDEEGRTRPTNSPTPTQENTTDHGDHGVPGTTTVRHLIRDHGVPSTLANQSFQMHGQGTCRAIDYPALPSRND